MLVGKGGAVDDEGTGRRGARLLGGGGESEASLVT